jgi:mannitol/fructose-specific phosphotransferase system IIA component (Ntr-type)
LTHAVRGLAVLLTELLTPGGVLVPIAARDKSGVIAELARHLTSQSGGDYQDVLGAVQEREAVLSTGIGFGVAIPHARSSAVQKLALVCGVSPEPVPFDSIDGEPVQLFFLIVGPESSAGQHVKVLSRIARLVRRDNVRERLSQARSPQEFYETLLELESQ